MFIHPGDGHTRKTLISMDRSNRMAQVQRNVIVIQALFNVAGKAAGVWLDLKHSLDIGSLKGQTSGHDHADITGA